jgi:SAM-dependent methyltransferase
MSCSIMKAMDIAGWENMYRSGERGRENHPTALLVETAAKLPPGSALDLACGTGRNALYLAEQGWTVTAVDGSESAIEQVRDRSSQRGLSINAQVADLAAPDFALQTEAFDLIVIAYYLQRNLFPLAKAALRLGGLLVAIAHTAEPGEESKPNRAASGELRDIFAGWRILHHYEGPSRDPAHRRPVSEIVARRPESSR